MLFGLKRCFERVNDQYLAHDVRNDDVHFSDRETQPSFEAIVCADGDLNYVAEVIEKTIFSLQILNDGVGLTLIFRSLFFSKQHGER